MFEFQIINAGVNKRLMVYYPLCGLIGILQAGSMIFFFFIISIVNANMRW